MSSQIAQNIDSDYEQSLSVDVGGIYQDHQPWLLNWLKGKLGCPYDAGDISQDTFLRLLSADTGVLREPRAYLLVIANRLLINRYRRTLVSGLIDSEYAKTQCCRGFAADFMWCRFETRYVKSV